MRVSHEEAFLIEVVDADLMKLFSEYTSGLFLNVVLPLRFLSLRYLRKIVKVCGEVLHILLEGFI
jgi:hypothetical protein